MQEFPLWEMCLGKEEQEFLLTEKEARLDKSLGIDGALGYFTSHLPPEHWIISLFLTPNGEWVCRYVKK